MTEKEYPQTQLQAIQYFADKDNCHDFVVMMRWPSGVKCPRCQSVNVGKFSGERKVCNCKDCKKQFTVKVGTIFEDSALGLDKWLPALWMIANAKNGISSCELHRSLGVTQKTAWHMAHRIRLALHNGNLEKFSGEVEADETYIGGKSRNKHFDKRVKGTGGVGKTAVQGLLHRHSKTGSKVITKVLRDTTRKSIQEGVRKHVEAGSNLYTDALHAYSELGGEYVHQFIDHAETYVNGRIHTNGLENFWCLLKRSIKGTYIAPRPFHMFRYLDEHTYRFNDRKLTDCERFTKALGSIAGKHLPYKKLIGRATA